jgi:hypothetical protein
MVDFLVLGIERRNSMSIRLAMSGFSSGMKRQGLDPGLPRIFYSDHYIIDVAGKNQGA